MPALASTTGASPRRSVKADREDRADAEKIEGGEENPDCPGDRKARPLCRHGVIPAPAGMVRMAVGICRPAGRVCPIASAGKRVRRGLIAVPGAAGKPPSQMAVQPNMVLAPTGSRRPETGKSLTRISHKEQRCVARC